VSKKASNVPCQNGTRKDERFSDIISHEKTPLHHHVCCFNESSSNPEKEIRIRFSFLMNTLIVDLPIKNGDFP
jgi:hypothetical protein